MITEFDIQVRVAELGHLNEPVAVSATIVLPEPDRMPLRPNVFFALAGGGYSRGYFTSRLPGPGSAAQARWHAEQGSIFVALDILGTDEPASPLQNALTLSAVGEAHDRAEYDILVRLANGTLHPGFPAVLDPVRIGIGHSLGACLTILQQGHHCSFDGVVALGYSPYLNRLQAAPGEAEVIVPWISRDVPPHLPGGILNRTTLEAAEESPRNNGGWSAYAWTSYYDDVPKHVVEQDLAHFENFGLPDRGGRRRQNLPWASVETPGKLGSAALSPGIVAPEAAAITVPVLAAMGERDMVADPKGEARCYLSTNSFELFVCPQMGHMHNFAGTRRLLWQRLELFAQGCAQLR